MHASGVCSERLCRDHSRASGRGPSAPRALSLLVYETVALPFVGLGLSLLAGAVTLPGVVFTSEVLASLLPKFERKSAASTRPVRLAVLVPAHDEAAGISGVVSALREQLSPGDRLLVVADNCTDDTAARARAAGAEVVERTDPDKRGKGYALTFGADHLASDPPDVVVIMDADCRVEAGSLHELAAFAAATDRPVQAVYLLHPPSSGGSFSGVSAFAFAVRNLVRPRGLTRLGLPSQLTGTGMAFPWQVFRDAPPTHSFLVEDLLLGHELALMGRAPLLAEHVRVTGELPSGDASSLKQRRRWEHGELSVLLQTAPRLLMGGLKRIDPGLFALALDAAVPPLALLVLLQGGSLIILGALSFWLGTPLPVAMAAAGTSVLALGVGVAWWQAGRQLVPLRDLVRIPLYILWKLPLYATFLRRGAHGEWERTDRTPNA